MFFLVRGGKRHSYLLSRLGEKEADSICCLWGNRSYHFFLIACKSRLFKSYKQIFFDKKIIICNTILYIPSGMYRSVENDICLRQRIPSGMRPIQIQDAFLRLPSALASLRRSF
jgi:hypothetical protein